MNSKKEKYKKTLFDLAKSGRFIEGIYNYCDRWCERCTMTSKCLTYAHEQEMKEGDDNPEVNDFNNEKFWEEIRMSFEVVREMLEEDARKMGVDLNNLEEVDQPVHVKSPLEILSEEYGYGMHEWLKTNQEKLEEKLNHVFMVNGEEEAKKLTDALEVVQYYFFFIPAKVHRAHFDLEERTSEEDEYDLYSDNLGSAKIAIIAVERSIDALSILYSHMEEDEDELLKFLSRLSQIKKQLLLTFPEVVDFKRPGFDN